MLQVTQLYYSYNQLCIFQNVSFTVSPGTITIILGRSGTGKTTLFHLLAGFLPPQQGEFLWGKSALTNKHVAYMQQKEALLPWRTVLKNILLPTELGPKTSRSPIPSDRLEKIIQNFDLTPLLNRYPDELSGGQRQRVALASQCLSSKPILLLDEPFSSLDMIIKEQLYQDIVFLAKKEGKTIVLVTHDFHDVLFLGDTLLVIKNNNLVPISLSPSMQSLNNRLYLIQHLKEHLYS
ncbi:ATP-binding cassette domain-containing protein [Candidatus Chlamydia sanziniae]|uniref:ABC transporter, ATP-binding protein n=1 Tax=Candidatus Chlamydia sanziniae TaxID=1806891 RepID=A0A1A9HVW9_9CHLA|nr:ABC transporter ATP-binding protein [Candidatus Chlamydia sanziniae]ANH78985.1 ABC transporter, ATP-binding protein [Candidatus Chlamydia sanziniae]